MTDDPAPRVWHHSGPEDRLSIATNRFLHRSLVPPFWACAMPDSDHGTRSDLQRIRDAAKGQRPGVLDWVVCQGPPPPLILCLELKRGKNRPTEHQKKTIADLTACGAPPVVAWTLAEVHTGLAGAGFIFLPNWQTTLAHMEAQLEAWDREAAGVKDGSIVKKRRPAKSHARKVPGLNWIRP
jgi:hypothetical protein